MRKTLLLLAAVCAAAPAGAQDWTLVAKGDLSGNHFYADPSSLRIHGPLRRMWVLTDYASSDRQGARSDKSYREFDCEERRARYLQDTYYRGPMGRGESAGMKPGSSAWSYVPPGSAGELLLEFACGR